MKEVKEMMEGLFRNLKQLARENAVVAKPISIEDRHVVPLCNLAMGYGGGLGEGTGGEKGKESAHGSGKAIGHGAGGGGRVTPVAVIVVEGDQVRLESLKQ